jgi:hypothetical protein
VKLEIGAAKLVSEGNGVSGSFEKLVTELQRGLSQRSDILLPDENVQIRHRAKTGIAVEPTCESCSFQKEEGRSTAMRAVDERFGVIEEHEVAGQVRVVVSLERCPSF